MKVHFWGNAPAGCYSYPYPDNYSHNDGHHGSKVHLFLPLPLPHKFFLSLVVSLASRSTNSFFIIILLLLLWLFAPRCSSTTLST